MNLIGTNVATNLEVELLCCQMLWDDVAGKWTHIGIQQCVHCLGAITLLWYCLLYEWKCYTGQVLTVNNQTRKHETFPPQQVA